MTDSDGRICWKCGTRYGNDVKLCVRCGVNLETGEMVRRHSDEDPFAATGVVGMLDRSVPGVMKPGLIALAAPLAVAGVVVLAAACGAFGMARYSSIGSIILLGVPGVALWGQATALILAGRFALLPTALGELDGLRWSLFFSSLIVEAMLVVGILRVA